MNSGVIAPNGPKGLGEPFSLVSPETGCSMARKSNPNGDTITAQQLAEQSGETYDAINHWARMGLLPYKKRGKARLFAVTECVKRCARIRELQEEDCNLAAIRRMLSAGQ